MLAVLQHDVGTLTGEKVHSLFNVMTMQKDARERFDHLELWFEATVKYFISASKVNPFDL